MDTNHDGELDATELSNAATALKTLDKNSDGKLTQEEFVPRCPRPGGPGGDGPKRRSRAAQE